MALLSTAGDLRHHNSLQRHHQRQTRPQPVSAGGDPVHFSEAFACAEPSSRARDLRAGSVTVDVINLSPGGSTWGTGAFANVHITPWKP